MMRVLIAAADRISPCSAKCVAIYAREANIV
jgi:hypothetical protein